MMISMGWLRSAGSLKLQVSFAKEPYKRDNFLQKRPTFLRSLLTVATPYHSVTTEQKGLRHLEMMDCKELTHFIVM